MHTLKTKIKFQFTSNNSISIGLTSLKDEFKMSNNFFFNLSYIIYNSTVI